MGATGYIELLTQWPPKAHNGAPGAQLIYHSLLMTLSCCKNVGVGKSRSTVVIQTNK